MERIDVGIRRKVSILPNDYVNLVNLPKINGVDLLGDMSTKELNLLSQYTEDYQTLMIDEINPDESYLVVVRDGDAGKLALSELLLKQSGGFTTADEVTTDVPVGAFMFVAK